MFGVGELLVIISLGVLFFGARKLPKLGGTLSETMRSFKKGLDGVEDPNPIRDVQEVKTSERPEGFDKPRK